MSCTTIDRSNVGVRDERGPLSVQLRSFSGNFRQKKLPNNRLALPGKSWIHHCQALTVADPGGRGGPCLPLPVEISYKKIAAKGAT